MDNKRDFHRAIGRRLAELRRDQQYTQAEVARLLGVSQQAQFAYELADRRVSTDKLAALARLFRVSVDQLIGIEPMKPVPPGRINPTELRHVEMLRDLRPGDRRLVRRVTEALRK